MKAKVAEVFKSIQGEGIYLGEKQIFVRFLGCNLDRCRFCDTQLDSFKEYETYELLDCLKLYSNDFHSISFTGGEPLVQSNFLKDFLPVVKQEGFKTYLETNATLPQALKDVIEYLDIIAADFKLSSSTGLRNFWSEHEAFLKIALQKEVFVKAVICKNTDLADVKRGVELLAKFNREIPFVLQPNSFEFHKQLTDKIQEFKNFALRYLSDVRIIPQMHKIAGVK
jgi:organic radical activating enzyme